MKKINLVLVTLLLSGGCFAQFGEFYSYRRFVETPPYSSEKVQKLLADSIPRFHYGHSGSLSAEIYAALSLRDKFAYNIATGESFAQNCSMDMDPGHAEKLLFAQLAPPFGEYRWSDRQYKFFQSNRDSVIALIKEYGIMADHLGVNFKHVIVNLDATSLIPFLIGNYRLHPKDHDILTVLMLLMTQNHYSPFLKSPVYETLYGTRESSYRRTIALTTADQDLIIRDANDFYHGLFK